MTKKFQRLIGYSEEKHQHINTIKTKYMHMSPDPIRTPIVIEDEKVIDAVEPNDGYSFVGFKLTYSDDIRELVENNLKSKMFNVAKFHAWLEYNDTTPFFIKTKVLYACLFMSLLYSAEAWGDILRIEKKLLAIEKKALKSCLGVKSGTKTDLIYIEIDRPDIVSIIKDRQFTFAEKIRNLKKDEALVKAVWDLVQTQESTSLRSYYENIKDKNAESNVAERKAKVETSEQSMCIRYKSMIGINHSTILYNSCLDDKKRTTITRWRLSSHKLKIETGRYTRPVTEKQNRLCDVCMVMGDENHAIYVCSAHRLIREKYKNILNLEDTNIRRLLNPTSIEEANNLAKFLNEIDENIKELEKATLT